MNDWRLAIVEMVQVKTALTEVDKLGIYPLHLPKLAATEDEITRTEHALGFSLDQSYRGFLKYANGWEYFWHTVQLFGTNDLLDELDDSLMSYANKLLAALDDSGVFRDSGVQCQELLPIATTRKDKDLFVMIKPGCANSGAILWFAGEEVDRYQNFDEYFMSMLEYNKLDVEYFSRDRIQ